MYYCQVILVCIWITTIKCQVINTKVTQTINIKNSLVVIDSSIIFKNLKPNCIRFYDYTLDSDVYDYYVKFRNILGDELTRKEDNSGTTISYRLNLNRNLCFNETYHVKVELILLNKIMPLFKKKLYHQDQYVLYKGNLLFYSPYMTLSLKNIYTVPNIHDLKEPDLRQHRIGDNLIYIFKNVSPFSFEQFEMQLKNNDPFLAVNHLKRTISVSHLSSICITDKINLKNEGSTLVGPYEPNITTNPHWLYTHLPAAVDEVQYYDTIGNSSKSILLNFKTHKTFKFQPRYPLMGGWKTFYVIKYCVPTYEYLYHDLKGHCILKIRVVDHVLNDVVVKQASIIVLLPDGSKIISAVAPQGFQEPGYGEQFTSLCAFGRPTVSLNGSNILESQMDYLTIEYSFSSLYLIATPLLLSVYIETVFLAVILIIRMKYLFTIM